MIVVFDTYDHVTSTARLKRAQVTAQIARDYEPYKQNVKNLILREYCSYASNDDAHRHCDLVESSTCAEYGSPWHDDNSVKISVCQTSDGRVTFLEPTQCLGFSLAVRSALRLCETPYVWVQQHDWTLAADIPVQSMLEVMQASEASEEVPVKYICLPSVRMLSYAKQTDVQRFPGLRALTASFKRFFGVSSQPGQCLPLTPLFFWYDKPHVALVEHYLARVFPSRYATSRGDFIEDTIGRRARDQMKMGEWHKWACWLYYPDGGTQLCLRHLDGRRWRGTEGELRQRDMYLAQKVSMDRSETAIVSGVANNGEPDQKGPDSACDIW